MKQKATQAIVLTRTNYGEADRIVTLLTPDQGKVRVLAKGVRKIKSRMAGGIELFSVNDITYIEGRGELCALISSRLQANYGNIIKDVTRTMYAYEVLKTVHKVTQDSPESEYFSVLQQALAAINDPSVDLGYIRLWLGMRLLSIGGHEPNLATDTSGQRLTQDKLYTFSYDDMAFSADDRGVFTSRHIKLLRLCGLSSALQLARIKNADELLPQLVQMLQPMVRQNLNF